MKKSVFMAGCAIMLSLSMMFATGCKKDDDDNGGGGGGSITNQVVVNGEAFDILTAAYTVEENVCIVSFVSQEASATFAFVGHSSIPTGTFSISNMYGDCFAMFVKEAGSLISTSGTITISKSGDNYTVTASGEAEEFLRATNTFSCSYSGPIQEYDNGGGGGGGSTSDNQVIVNDESFDILVAAYTVEENVCIVSFASQEASASFAFVGHSSIPTGTFSISNMYGDCFAMFVKEAGSLISTSGTITISKSGDNYTVTASGEAEEYLRATNTFSCSYSGPIQEFKK